MAQKAITGKVTAQDGEAINGATIVIKNNPEGGILAFAVSNQEGHFELVISVPVDSFFIQVSHLNYETQAQWFRINSGELLFKVAPRVYDLPTLEVKQEPVIRRGDTLIFDVNQLREEDDENIEALLQRIPGITVSPSGAIRYHDLEISNFYIEGLDMMEGRYAIVTRNLAIDAIRDIEILERHQHIRALDSLVRPPNAAINLRLKSKIAFTGTIKAGLGGEPLLGIAEASAFGFSQRQQFALLGSANNVGQPLGENFQDHYQVADFRLSLVSPDLAIQPLLLPAENYLDNREISCGFNFLKKHDPSTQFKWNGFATSDRILSSGRNTLRYQSKDEAIVFNELLNAREIPLRLESRLHHEINEDRIYVNSSAGVRWDTEQTEVTNEVNNAPASENFAQNELIATAKSSAIIRRGNNAYRLKTNVNFRDMETDLLLYPLSITTPGELPFMIEKGNQAVRQKVITSDLHTDWIFRSKSLRGESRLGLQTDYRSLNGRVEDLGDDDVVLLDSAFVNDSRQRFVAPYLDYVLTLDRDKTSWKVTLPLSAHFTRFEDSFRETSIDRTLIVTRPALDYTLRLPNQRFLNATYYYNRDYLRDLPLFTGYLIRQNRQLGRSLPNLNLERRHGIQLRLRGTDYNTKVDYDSYLTASIYTYSFLAATVFDRAGEASVLISDRNTGKQVNWANKFSKSFASGLDVKLNLRYGVRWLPLNLNGNRVGTAIRNVEFLPVLTYSFGQNVVSFRPELRHYENTLSASAVLQSRYRFTYFTKLPRKGGSFKLNGELHQTVVGGQRVNNKVVGFNYKRSILDGKFELNISLNNLTNENSYVTYTQSAYYEELSSFTLRPRQFLVTIGRML